MSDESRVGRYQDRAGPTLSPLHEINGAGDRGGRRGAAHRRPIIAHGQWLRYDNEKTEKRGERPQQMGRIMTSFEPVNAGPLEQ